MSAAAPRYDNYPTRLAHPTEPIERMEPAVWGDEAGGPLRDGELRAMAADGYLLRPSTVAARSLPDLCAELDRIGAKADGDDPRVIREANGDIRSVFQPQLFSELIGEVITLDTVLPIARQLLGSDVYLHQTRINMMGGFSGSGFYWHSDFETWHAEDGMPAMRAVSCSIALTDNHPYNGPLMIMPGSHRTFYPCVGPTPANNHASSLVKQEVGVPDRATLATAARQYGIIQVTGVAGTALWFDSNVIHGSASNITPFPRSNIFLVFNSVENALVEPFRAEQRRPDFLAARCFEGFAAQAVSR